MLLTKPLSTFLNANRSPHIQTLFLATPNGKLLSSSSGTPANLLRNQATIASSIWELYGPLTAAGTIGAALPSSASSADSSPNSNSPSSDDEDEDARHGNARRHHHVSDPAVTSIVIQLDTSTMVIRALRCSLLFVVIGPAPSSLASSSSTRGLTQGMSFLSVQSANTATGAGLSPSSPPTSSHSQTNGDGAAVAERRLGESSSASLNGLGGGGGASASAGPSLKVFKRLAEELAKCLDVELEGFTLSTGL